MEPATTLFGVMAAIPQTIGAAKELYNLRSRYKDASVLITAIYSESMVIAASLSQIQLLLQHDAMKSKPQLLETFDRALTGCRVVYGCLEEEVRELIGKAENDDLRFRDRAKFLMKEDVFKELLTQIRGQQSALSLLIQGLQMESIADIRQLVSDNSTTLEQLVNRSKSLRQSHPRVHVPESIFGADTYVDDRAMADVESIAKSSEFAFDDEIVQSTVYRKAMASYALRHGEAPIDEVEINPSDDDTTVLGSLDDGSDTRARSVDGSKASESDRCNKSSKSEIQKPENAEERFDSDQLDFLEQQMLPFMPPKVWHSPSSLSLSKDSDEHPAKIREKPSPPPERPGQTRNYNDINVISPPLSPRRQSTMSLALIPSNNYSISSNESSTSNYTSSCPSRSSRSSSYTVYESSEHRVSSSTLVHRKPLPRAYSQALATSSSTIDTTSALSLPTITSISLLEPSIHAAWHAILENERNFIDRLTKFHSMFYTSVATKWPVLHPHLSVIAINIPIAQLHRNLLLADMERAISNVSNPAFDPFVFEHWAQNARRLYFEYCSGLPHAVSSLRTAQKLDSKFVAFVNTLGLSLVWFGKTWEDYLKLPIAQMEFYIESLQSMIATLEASRNPFVSQDIVRLQRTLQTLASFQSTMLSVLTDAQIKEDIQTLEKSIYTSNSEFLSRLQLLHPSRRVRYQSDLAIKLQSQGAWLQVHAILLDNYLLWGKVKAEKKGRTEQIYVLDAPIATSDLEIGRPDDDYEFQKSGMFDEGPRGSVLYIINIRSRTDMTKSHMLGIYSWDGRRDWWEQLSAVVGK